MFQFSLYFGPSLGSTSVHQAILRDPEQTEALRSRIEQSFKGCSLDHQPGAVIIRFKRETPGDLVEETERLDALIKLTQGQFGRFSLGRVDVADPDHKYLIASAFPGSGPSFKEAVLRGLARAYIDARDFLKLSAPAFA